MLYLERKKAKAQDPDNQFRDYMTWNDTQETTPEMAKAVKEMMKAEARRRGIFVEEERVRGDYSPRHDRYEPFLLLPVSPEEWRKTYAAREDE